MQQRQQQRVQSRWVRRVCVVLDVLEHYEQLQGSHAVRCSPGQAVAREIQQQRVQSVWFRAERSV
jgi:hypothetical protein